MRARPRAGDPEAERQFRRVIGYRDLAKLAVAVEHDVSHDIVPPAANNEAKSLITA